MRPLKDCPPAGRPIDRDADCGMSLRDLGSALALDVADEGTHALDAKSLFARGATTGPGRVSGWPWRGSWPGPPGPASR
ncbi:hypothetical protein [Streptomyces sp. NPDC091212]|uniref:hypothetical protein n=1 Tax=Streptomyces sp. NPDC091212 TaxID=3155191 RepID=UPI00343346E4